MVLGNMGGRRTCGWWSDKIYSMYVCMRGVGRGDGV